ncbi:Hypothetical_protein [Hexamita inflata]|uniref:Hypothetical_protein n=1 Tax=Hexamita inflata TaxID=28002 RepID=A0AA86PSY5_9EUKA|nr:Hypothetical protein HINF_LOCUS31993 [Hexamita inflata]CAI9968541.1 Hypothetical protein HINF_LOCUS56186 [Hexamita inflata]
MIMNCHKFYQAAPSQLKLVALISVFVTICYAIQSFGSHMICVSIQFYEAFIQQIPIVINRPPWYDSTVHIFDIVNCLMLALTNTLLLSLAFIIHSKLKRMQEIETLLESSVES